MIFAPWNDKIVSKISENESSQGVSTKCFNQTPIDKADLNNDLKEPVLVINPWYEQVLTIETACQLIYPFCKNVKFKDVIFIIRFNQKSEVRWEPEQKLTYQENRSLSEKLENLLNIIF